MKITKVIGLDDLKKILRSSYFDKRSSELLMVTDVIEFKQISKKDIFWTRNRLLLPSVNIINLYTAEGKEAMETEYIKQLYYPESYFVINEIMYRTVSYDLDFFIGCAAEEDEYDYIKFLAKFINEIYDVKCLSTKKFLDGKKMKMNRGIKDMYKQITDTREELIKQLRYANIDPLSLIIDLNDKKALKNMPEQMKELVLHKKGMDER